jgi:hypothetical protein
VLTSRRLVAATVLAAVASLVPVLAPSAGADDPPGCTLIICPTLPPDFNPGLPTGHLGNPDDGQCVALTIPVLPADAAGLSVPAGIPGRWAYQLCGDTAVVGRAPRTGTGQSVKAWCADPSLGDNQCSVVVFWHPNAPAVGVPVAGRDGGFNPIAFNRFPADAKSNPADGRVIAQFPTWFWDNNMVGFLGAPIPAPGGFGAGAIAIHTGSHWDVDGRRICGSSGDVPLTTDAGPSPSCGHTFSTVFTPGGGTHRAELTKNWLIIVFLEFPPYVLIIPWVEDDTINIVVREAQADTH